jgi:hypothetical protein
MKKGLVVGAGGVIGGVVLVVAVSAANKKGKSPVDVTLDMVGSNCVATITDVLGGKKNGNVKWKVKNNCESAQYIRFENFRRRHIIDTDLDAADPDTVNPPAPSGTIAARSTGDVDATISRNPKYLLIVDTCKYDVYLGADASSGRVVLDPDVEIWPF